jgi:hypothetical protein
MIPLAALASASIEAASTRVEGAPISEGPEEVVPPGEPPEAPPESEPPVEDPVPEPDPPVEDPVEEEEADPAPEDPVEIPGPAEVPESVMEAMAGNLSDADITKDDPWPADHTPKRVGMLHFEDTEPDVGGTTMTAVGSGDLDDLEAEAKAEEILEDELLDNLEARAEAAAEVSFEAELDALDALDAEAGVELELLPADEDDEIDEELDNLLNGAGTIADPPQFEVLSMKVTPGPAQKDDWELHDPPEFDTYVIRVPKGTVITLEKQE